MPKVDPDSKIERRYFQAQGMEVRAEGDDEPAVLMGYAALFDETSEDLGGFRERIAQGAFANTIGGDIRALFNHDTNLILGRTKANTLRLLEDQRGLRCEITLPDTNTARDLRESVRLGNVDQMSFGFRTKKDSWDEVDGAIVRTLIEVELFDVSPVTFPAYPQTELALRSMGAWDTERKMRNVPNYDDELRRLDLIGL
ncbi:HK97 family phage prohead protease [Sulfitobacter sp. M57]|uniref:HK97 family phage prohead protease n=1 Tax=unclassified Sulfitobacter TaxID=196795 RepID=UPI0023E13225|nr:MULTISPECIES: HK97 family phage prohead protease [unclassified Sulfitobacter]MDF3413279.1 HK97 family phage prohead protease [Sulfitobacter sp. KE5]MDF3421441.1 HK97 family phage prohead protease [Sulfitobacter sp. KE43]MDF3431826.1 HK97 family phage prohead protease [Sulfitobacter sp. KE42]MDF3457466.1 HK97 family phage prohead protease [Sulfitobacter sp. S74]MDF3461368.1 HK97 family phage prohead protease [Sulfitobacter sp. Ks18]